MTLTSLYSRASENVERLLTALSSMDAQGPLDLLATIGDRLT
jgi:hypothetical protein